VNSSLGVVKVRPSIDVSMRCPLQAASLLLGAAVWLESVRTLAVRRVAAFGPEMPLSGLVPPLPLLSAATAYSTSCLPGLLRPGADHGVRQVSASATSSEPFPAGLLRGCAVSPPGPFPTPRGLVWTSPSLVARLLRGGDGQSAAATGSSDGRVVIPTGALPFEAFPLPAAGAASTVPRACVSVRSGAPR
jgi:hypothetical protein